jgi:DNA helicase-2/ATP-dependent DNA helicase PcrA
MTEDTNALLSQLNDVQRQAVTYSDGPELVIAGAGSGKTRVLTYKIAYLMQQGLKPWNILALTFTNKAAKEMKDRIVQLLDYAGVQKLQMGTFHSIFSRILRVESQYTGYNHDFNIYDESDSRSLIKKIVKQLGLDDKTYKPATVHGRISRAKNRLYTPEDYLEDENLQEKDLRAQMPDVGRIYQEYQRQLRQANCMDFDDLLVITFQLLNEHEEVRQKYAHRFDYVLVDEYQDTNYAQQRILWLLTKEQRRLCVVGDDYQSIYAFRGANIDNILGFQQLYTDTKLFKLEQNYRSTQRIVAAANSLMTHNARQIPKTLFSKNEEGDNLTILETISDKREAATVCREIKKLHQKEHCRWSDFAILYRTNAQSRLFEDEMRKPDSGLSDKYRIYGGLSFYQRKEIKDIIAYFRLVVNPLDSEALLRIINYPSRGIGNTTLQRLINTANESQTSIWDVLSNPISYPLPLNRGTLGKLEAFRDLIRQFIAQLDKTDALTLGKDIIEKSGIRADLDGDKTAEGAERKENVNELVSGLAAFVMAQREDGLGDHDRLSDYLSTVSLLSDQDNDTDDADDRITMMTIHAAKGLEFRTVFVVGMEENMFPSLSSSFDLKGLDEERRLLYVAITRAEKHCYLTWAHERWRFGKRDPHVVPSQFLNDIDPQYVTKIVEGGGYSSRRSRLSWDGWGDGEDDGQDMFQDDYEINKPYTGTHSWGSDRGYGKGRMQNSRPVAAQFMADPKPKITAPRQPEKAVNPFSGSMESLLKKEGRWQRVSKAMANGGRRQASSSAPSASSMSQMLHEGTLIEHQRFGKGRVVKIEGTGENTKATVDFDDTGTKQLLLKFARFTIIG